MANSAPIGRPVLVHGRVRLDVPNDRALVRPLRDFVAALCEESGISARKVRAVRLAVGELFENSVEHGPKGAHSVSIVVEIRHGRMRFELTEKAPASEAAWRRFVGKIRAAPGPPEDPDAGRGWGIRLVHGQMDRCDAKRLPSGKIRVLFETRV